MLLPTLYLITQELRPSQTLPRKVQGGRKRTNNIFYSTPNMHEIKDDYEKLRDKADNKWVNKDVFKKRTKEPNLE